MQLMKFSSYTPWWPRSNWTWDSTKSQLDIRRQSAYLEEIDVVGHHCGKCLPFSTFLVHMVGEFTSSILWHYHQEVFSGDNRTLLTPFSLVLPRVINTPMALMTTPQNLQGSIILGWRHRTICFPIGPCTILQTPTNPPWGRSFVHLSGALLGLLRSFLVCIAFPFHFSL